MADRKPRSVVVTGGGGGLGRVICERFLALGDCVHTCDISDQGLRTLEQNWPADRVRFTVANVGDAAQINKVFTDAAAWMPEVDVLVNNVGAAGPRAAVEHVATDDWAATLNANLWGAIHSISAVLPGMKQRKRGAIVNISTSSVATKPLDRAPYTVSKAALESLALCVAREAGSSGVRCNVVRPGAMDNDRLRTVLARIATERNVTTEQVLREELKYVSMKTVVSMEDVASMVLYLASDSARHVTGQILAVDGGAEWEQ